MDSQDDHGRSLKRGRASKDGGPQERRRKDLNPSQLKLADVTRWCRVETDGGRC